MKLKKGLCPSGRRESITKEQLRMQIKHANLEESGVVENDRGGKVLQMGLHGRLAGGYDD